MCAARLGVRRWRVHAMARNKVAPWSFGAAEQRPEVPVMDVWGEPGPQSNSV
jgi:hypothetical protein